MPLEVPVSVECEPQIVSVYQCTERAVRVISSDPPCKEGGARFTMIS